jgi:hypothetical protein
MALPRVDVARAFLLGFALGAVVGVCAAWL